MARLDITIIDYALPKVFRYHGVEVLDTEVDAMIEEIEAIINRYEIVDLEES